MAQRLATQHGGKQNPLDTTGLCLLSLDGGGVRGLSALYILKALMTRLNSQRQNAGLPSVKPCEVFDLIGGTSTGGLIAIMLGRLAMDVDECITAYSKLIKAVFGEKLNKVPINFKGNIKPQFDSATLEGAIKEVITSRGISEAAKLNDGVQRGCRVFVCTTSYETKGIRRLRSYVLPDEPDISVTICEAALATSAATTFFDIAQIGARKFVDGALGANNPVDEVEDEASNIWCSKTADLQRQVKCFISIGTGHPGKKAIEDKMITFFSKTLVDLATETERTADKFVSRWRQHFDKNRYFRFNVQQGLQDVGLAEYQEQGLIEAATEEYLTQQEQRSRMRECVSNLKLKENRTETSFVSTIEEYEIRHIIQSQTAVNKACWIVPFGRNKQFVGQDSHLDRLQNVLFTEHQPPKIAITGLGGVGKTQIALELAYRTKEQHQDCSVLWIPATNPESLQQAFADIGQQLGVPGIEEKQANVKKLVQRHLSQESAGQWLLIVDNVDDMDMWSHELKAYLPKSQRGCVVCTTRNRKVAVKVAAVNVIEVPEMDEEMAMQLLAKSLIHKEVLTSRQDARKLLEQLTFLPLAIVQAAVYINENGIVLSDYLSLLDQQEQDVVDLLSEDFEDDGRYQDVKNPVATTWLISFEHIRRLNPLAVEYLSFMSCVDPKDIPQSLLPPGQSRKKETDAIGTLNAYSFVRKRPGDEALSVHRLVHLATRNWLRTKDQWHNWVEKALTRLVEVIPLGEHNKREDWKAYLPHARYILDCTPEENILGERSALLGRFAVCLIVEGRYKEASNAFLLLVETLKQVLGEDHPTTLDNMGNLASTYTDQGQWEEAEDLYLHVIEAKARVLGEDSPSVLTTRNNLAKTYYMQGRWKEAEKQQAKVLEILSRDLGAEHPSTLTSMNNLASTYSVQGRWKEAEELEAQVMETRKRVLGEEHPDTLISMNNLALTYSRQGRWKDAEELFVQVIETSKRVLDEEHPDTLTCMNNLASTYFEQGRWKDAEELEVQVMETRKRVLGEEHPNTLNSMNNLALTYSRQGRWKDAEELFVQVIETSKRVLDEEHPDTLKSMNNLALTYSRQGRWKDAEELEVQVTETSKRVLGEEHPDTLTSMNNLASTYSVQGWWKEAEELFVQIIETSKRVLGEEHPGTLNSINNLAFMLEGREAILPEEYY